jgi:hypothetical protein
MSVLELMGVCFLVLLTSMMFVLISSFIKVLVGNIQKKGEYLTLLKVEAKIKKERDKYMKLLEKFESFSGTQRVDTLNSVIPTKNHITDIIEFNKEWNTLSTDDKLKMLVHPGLESIINKTTPEEEVNIIAKSQADEILEMSKKVTTDEIYDFLINIYPIKKITKEHFGTVWNTLNDEQKKKMLTQDYTLEEVTITLNIPFN